jgi:hypothetical protein
MNDENIFTKLKIIADLSKIIRKYLTNSHNNFLDGELKNVNTKEIIKYHDKLMLRIKNIIKYNVFIDSAEYGKFKNMKWLLKKNFHLNKYVFENALRM